MFVDSHAHLDGKQLDTDREAVIARALEAGVRTMVAIGNGEGASPPEETGNVPFLSPQVNTLNAKAPVTGQRNLS